MATVARQHDLSGGSDGRKSERGAVGARKTSPQARCKAPLRDEVMSGHPRDERRNRLQTDRRRSAHRHDAVPITFACGGHLSSAPGNPGTGDYLGGVVVAGSLHAFRNGLLDTLGVTRHPRLETMTSAAALTVQNRSTGGRRQENVASGAL